ncbi:MAG TPA: hypothetical protein VGO62_00960 [Myxococcota bacterium]|jgi:hypothetical protein
MIDDDDDDAVDGGDLCGDQGRALWALPGLEPFSGGFAVDVTFLLAGGASTIALTLFLSALLRTKRGEAVTVIGTEP